MNDIISKPEILIVDNDTRYAERMTHILGSGYSFHIRSKKEDYISVVREREDFLKVIIIDIGDSRDNDYQDLKMLKGTGAINKIPVIGMSAEEDDFDLENAFGLGVYDFTYKYCAGSIIRNRVAHFISFYSNHITKVREERARNSQRDCGCESETDMLTGCLNYEFFAKKFTEITSGNPDRSYGIVFYDIENMTYINSIYGYKVGDEVLRIAGNKSLEMAEGNGCVARVSADRFVTLYDIDTVQAQARKPIEQIEAAINQYMRESKLNHMVRVRAGAYRIKPEDLAKKTLAQIVDYALTAHKETKKNRTCQVCLYDDTFIERQKRVNLLIDSLDAALESGEIVPWFQPQIDCRNGNVIGAEVLCRWFSKSLGFVSPGEFIPVFEESGQISKVDMYIWEEACRQIHKWKQESKQVVPLSINVSRKEMAEGNLETVLPGLLKKYDLTPELLRIEITESAYMDEPQQLISTVNNLKDQGFTVEMDDFGSGYSSLNMLKDVPVDVLKLDMRFLAGMTNNISGNGGSIISAIIRMAKGMNLSVIAEGVETREQCIGLRNMGCSIIQGYYYAKPMGIADFEEYLSTRKTGEMPSVDNSEEMIYLRNLLDYNSISSHIFDNFIGPAAVLELIEDRMEVLKINDKFMDEMGDKEQQALKYMSDGTAMVAEADKPKVIQSLKHALKHGEAGFETYLPSTKQWVKLLYRLLFVGPVSSYYYCEIKNTTDKHILGDQFKQYVELAETTMDAIPSGVFKYQAEGEQKFAYISRSLLWMLGYKTRDEFLVKFDNRFPNMIYHEDRERVLNEINKQITESQDMDYCEYRVECADGTLKTVLDYGHLVIDDGGNKWFYVVVSDAELRKKAKESV